MLIERLRFFSLKNSIGVQSIETMEGWGEFPDKWNDIKGDVSKHITKPLLPNNPQLLKKLKTMKENELQTPYFFEVLR